MPFIQLHLLQGEFSLFPCFTHLCPWNFTPILLPGTAPFVIVKSEIRSSFQGAQVKIPAFLTLIKKLSPHGFSQEKTFVRQ